MILIVLPFCKTAEARDRCFSYVKGLPIVGQISHAEGRGIGYERGYTTVSLFAIPISFSPGYLFFDVRDHLFNNGRNAGNVGAGARYCISRNRSAVGINLYYDWRQTHPFWFRQWGAGAEYLAKWGDVRLNGYFPASKRAEFSHCYFTGNYHGGYFLKKNQFNVALSGWDLEVGAYLNKYSTVKLYGAMGPYYFIGPFHNHAIGGKARLKCNFKQYLSLEFIVMHDNLFETCYQSKLSLEIPFRLFFKQEKRHHFCEPVLVVRREIIPVHKTHHWERNF